MGNTTAEPAPPPRSDVFQHMLDRLLPDDPVGSLLNVAAFLTIVLLGVLIGWGLRRSQMRLLRGPPTAGQTLMSRLLQATLVITAIVVGLSAVYEVNVLGIVATLGLISLALGFGLQNTVANLAAGVGLTIDRPFDVGDRIRVEDTWGDVQAIGLRSTRIVTTAGEHVVIPNAVLDTQAVWNYSRHGAERLRIDIPIGVTYDSSLPLAENLALRAARSTDGVLPYPDPEVIFLGYGDNSVDLELRFWVRRPRDRNPVRNRVIRAVKDVYDAQGVHFPFPQRTISYLSDLPDAAQTPEHLEGEGVSRPVVLILETGSGDQAFARRAARLADELRARLVILHVRPAYAALDAQSGMGAVNLFLEQTRRIGVPASGRTESGPAAEVLVRVAKEVGARLVFVDARRNFRLPASRRPGNGPDALNCPLVWIQAGRDPPESAVEQWQRLLHPEDFEEEEEEEPEEEESGEGAGSSDGEGDGKKE